MSASLDDIKSSVDATTSALQAQTKAMESHDKKHELIEKTVAQHWDLIRRSERKIAVHEQKCSDQVRNCGVLHSMRREAWSAWYKAVIGAAVAVAGGSIGAALTWALKSLFGA